MDATVIVIDRYAETCARWPSLIGSGIRKTPALSLGFRHKRPVAAYEESKWPRRPPRTTELIRHLLDQHRFTPADVVPRLGTPSRVSEVLRATVQRLRALACAGVAFSFRAAQSGAVRGGSRCLDGLWGPFRHRPRKGLRTDLILRRLARADQIHDN